MTEFKNYFFRLRTSQAVRSTAIVYLGIAISAALSFTGTIIIARVLGPAAYGLIAIALAVMSTLSEYGDLGISATLVRFVSYLLKHNPPRAERMLKVALLLQIGISIAVGVLGYFISAPLALLVFRKPELIGLLRLTFLAVSGIILGNFAIANLQARQWFAKMSLMQALPNFIKIIGFGALYFWHRLDPQSVLVIYVLGFFLSFAIGFSIIPKEFWRARQRSGDLKSLFHFSKWVIVSIICYGLYRRVDVLVLGRLLDPVQVGLYSAMLQFTVPIAMLQTAISIVLFPKVSGLSGVEELKELFPRAVKIIVLVFLSFIPLVFLGRYLVMIFFGSSFLPGLVVFPFLILQVIILSLRVPFALFLYALNKPYLYALTDFGRLTVGLIAMLLTVPRFGIIAAALTTLSVTVVFIGIEAILVLSNLYDGRQKKII